MLALPAVLRRLALALAAGAVVAAPLAPVAARAEEPPPTTLTGELVQAWTESRHDDEHTAPAQPLTWVETPDGASVRLRTDEVAGVPPGATVEVTVGEPVADPDDRSGLGPAHDVIGSRVVRGPEHVATPARPLTNEVTVVLVRPAGAPADDVRPEAVAAVVDGSVADFWSGQTGGAVTLGVTRTHDWVTTTAGCDEPAAMWNEAAAAAGFEGGPGRHLLVYVSSAADENCGYGLAEVGALLASGGRAYVRDLEASLIAHELGHNFGLGHSSALHCDGGTEAAPCRTAPYRDHYDVMGGSWEQVGSLTVVQAARLGLLASDALRTVQADGALTRLTLSPLSGASGVRSVRLLAPGGQQYWLELRTAAGQDAWLAGERNRFGLQAGVLLRRSGTWPDTSLLLDPTPTAGRDGDLRTALPAGRPVSLAGGAFTVTVGTVGPAGVTVQVASRVPVPAPTPAPAPAVPVASPPDVLAAEGVAAPLTPDPPATEALPPAPRAARPPAVDVAAVTPAPGAPAEASPVVVPAASSRSLLLPGVGALLGCAAFLVARRLVRGRVRG